MWNRSMTNTVEETGRCQPESKDKQERKGRKKAQLCKQINKSTKREKRHGNGQTGGRGRPSKASTRMPSRALVAKHSFSSCPSAEPGCGKSGKNERIRKGSWAIPKGRVRSEEGSGPHPPSSSAERPVWRGYQRTPILLPALPHPPPLSPSPAALWQLSEENGKSRLRKTTSSLEEPSHKNHHWSVSSHPERALSEKVRVSGCSQGEDSWNFKGTLIFQKISKNQHLSKAHSERTHSGTPTRMCFWTWQEEPQQQQKIKGPEAAARALRSTQDQEAR